MSARYPSIIFGCASVGAAYDTKESVVNLLDVVKKCGIDHLDTAARYPSNVPGNSERLLGEAGAADRGFTIDSKILTSGDAKGTLEEGAIDQSIARSLDSLHVGKVNILYCHQPDTQTPIKEQAAAFDKHYKDGKFTHLGVSNFPLAMLKEWFKIADEFGYIKPTFYQGQFNLVCQGYADELLSFLRQHSVHFVAYSPLAGGFLTGKLTPSTDAKDLVGTRFEVSDKNPSGAIVRQWYDKPGMHAVTEKLRALAETSGVSMPGLALRWLVYHSALKAGDSVILGASKPEQLVTSVEQIRGGPLNDDVATEMNGLWAICAEDAQSLVS